VIHELHRHLALLNFLIAGVRVGANVTVENVTSSKMLYDQRHLCKQ
jgi:hypothetical protein